VLCGKGWGRITNNEEEQIVKIRQWKQSHLTTLTERDFTAKQEALLSALILDRRNNAWARELLRRRNGVARWRGQPGCSVREIIEAVDALPSRPYDLGVAALAIDSIVELEAA
jgi:hypothetical protein